MAKYNGWEDPEWRDYWGVNDPDPWDPFGPGEAAESDDVIGWEDMAAVGMILFILGACAMDSASLVLPAALVATGILLIGLGWRRSVWTTSGR